MFIDGTELGSAPAVAKLLTASMVDAAGETRVGQMLNGTGQFLGRIQDLRSYNTTLSNRLVSCTIAYGLFCRAMLVMKLLIFTNYKIYKVSQ